MERIVPQSRHAGGLSLGAKEGPRSSFLHARSMDYRTDPHTLKILPKASKVSGTIVTDLVLDAERQGTDTYLYGNAGNLYKRDSSEVWTKLRTVANSSGNGLRFFGEDNYLYYPSNKVIGRYGPFGGTKDFTDDFLGAEGGVPTNTHSLVLNGTTQYATAADSATLSITSDLSIEGYFKHDSLPAEGGIQVLASKWNENGNERSYIFDMTAIAAFFGDGGDGALTVSANATDAPTDSAATATAATNSISATNASFAAGDKIAIHQTQGTGAGKRERTEIASYTAGTITTTDSLTNTYTSRLWL